MRAQPSRRALLGGLASAALAAPALAGAKAHVVVIGGGFGGVSAARALAGRGIRVTLVEPETHYVTCPASNAVIGGLRPIGSITFGYDALPALGIAIVRERANAIDASARKVVLASGQRLDYDRLIVSPGVAMRFDAIPGYDEAATERMPHAWKAGAQTELLRRQLEAMEDGGTVVITAPGMPYRCPPGPYERASLIAHYLQTHKPRSKVLLLDAKDKFSKQPLFEEAWKKLYPQHLEWVPKSKGGHLLKVDAANGTLRTEGGLIRASVANVIPPQRAPTLCFDAGLADAYGWCRIEPRTFESIRVPGIHVIGDASAAGAMPKSAFSANAQAELCARAVSDLLEGRAPREPKLINACYSLVAPERAISIANVYEVEWDGLVAIPGVGGVSPSDASDAFRAREARYGETWYRTVTQQMFG